MVLAYEEQYLEGLNQILNKGKWVYNERTKTRCLTIPRLVMEYKLDEKSAPLLTTRPSYPVSALAEILGYMRRYTWATQFDEIGTKSWFKNANETSAWLSNPNRLGEDHVGDVYGAALPKEYIEDVWSKIHRNIDDRGLKFDWWQPEKFDKGCLRPCLSDHNFIITGDQLDLTSSQRSCDYLVGKNFNAIQVYGLGMLGCKAGGLEGGTALHIMNNVHIYEPHLEGIEELLTRKPTELDTTFKINDWVKTSDDILGNDIHARDYFTLEGYKGVPQPKIDFEMVA